MVSRRAESEARAIARGKGGKKAQEKIICCDVPRKRDRRRVLANFERQFVPYQGCCITEASTTSDGGNCRLSVYLETGDCDPEYKERANE